MSGYSSKPEGITHPSIDELLQKTPWESKYALVITAAKRARQINNYYAQLAEGLLENVGPLVETQVQEKSLSIALREIHQGKLDVNFSAAPEAEDEDSIVDLTSVGDIEA